MAKYKRILLKFSGEALAGDKKQGFDEATCISVAEQVKKIVDEDVQVAVVIGGGNFWRGRDSETIDRFKADQIGMLATVMNCVYVSEIFRFVGMKTSIYTPYTFGDISELFTKDRAVSDLETGKVIFLAGGTGHPYFSTDTATALRAVELNCDIILMAFGLILLFISDLAVYKGYTIFSVTDKLKKPFRIIAVYIEVFIIFAFGLVGQSPFIYFQF